MSSSKIAIIGGGPGGLLAAHILTLHNQNVTVFERETSFSKRSQGGSLDIHADSGQLALERAALTEEFRKIARYEDQESRIYDKHDMLRHVDANVTGKDRPETDRGHLRGMLLASLPAGVIRWDSRVNSVAPLLNGRWQIHLTDGTAEDFDVVVGADGTWSKIRPLLSNAVPQYTGILMIEYGIERVDQRYPHIAEMAGRGLTFALGDSKAIIAHRDANSHMGGYIGLRVEENWFAANGLDKLPPSEAHESPCAEFSG